MLEKLIKELQQEAGLDEASYTPLQGGLSTEAMFGDIAKTAEKLARMAKGFSRRGTFSMLNPKSAAIFKTAAFTTRRDIGELVDRVKKAMQDSLASGGR